ncbi:hypothetical protein, partial [Pseudomonas sp. 2822-15]|uniref:hypothetical protein n=1 Tax=Pseudomonas sp. 2822-15 TaxID=1712677 RepID=UPI001C44533F
VEMVQIDPMYPMHFPDGSTFVKWSDERRQLEEIAQHFPGEEESYKSYLNEMRERFKNGKSSLLISIL